MNTLHYALKLLGLFVLVIIFSSCKREGCTDPQARNYDPKAEIDNNTCRYPDIRESFYNLFFNPVINGNSITYDSMGYLNAAGNTFSIKNLKYYVSNFVLHEVGGDSVVFPSVSSTNYISLRKIPAGEYNKLSFLFGLSPEMNLTGQLENNPDNNMMRWPEEFGSGYHFLKMEGSFMDENSQVSNYNIDIGHYRTSTTDLNPARRIELTFKQIRYVNNMDGGYFHTIAFDVLKLLNNPEVYDFNEHPGSYNLPAHELLNQNLSNSFSITGFGIIM